MADVTFSVPKSYSVALSVPTPGYLLVPVIPYTYSNIFTIEFWFKTTSTIQQGLFFSGDTASNTGRFQLEINTLAGITLYAERTTTSNQGITSAPGIISTDTWYHLAVVKQGTLVNIYLNGINIATATSTVNLSDTFANNLYIGLARSGNALRYLIGYISNFRVVDGSAVYTGSFTPPTELLYPIQNTTLLTCQSSTFIDNSYNQSPINPVGYALIDTDNPFGVTTSTPVSAEAFDDISTTDSVINLQILPAKSVFDIYDIQSSINAPVDVVGTDEILFRQSLSKLTFDVIDILSGIDSPVNAVGTDGVTQITFNKSSFDISEILSSIDDPVDAVVTNELIIPKALDFQRSLQYNINNINVFPDITPITSFEEAVVNVSQFSKKQIIERTSPQKINTLRVLIENTVTTGDYSYWI
jgi:hypothetical protein